MSSLSISADLKNVFQLVVNQNPNLTSVDGATAGASSTCSAGTYPGQVTSKRKRSASKDQGVPQQELG